MRFLPGQKGFSSGGFRLILLLYLSLPILSLIVAGTLLKVPAEGIVRILLSPLFYFSGALAVLAAVGLGRLQRWGWILFRVSNLLLLYQTAFWVATFSSAQWRFVLFASAATVIMLLYWRVGHEVRRPYFLPRIRWWELGSPSFVSIEAVLQTSDSRRGEGEILDLSTHGCFVKTPFDLPLGGSVTVVFEVDRASVQITGMVVWRAASAVTHPRGLGIRFKALDRSVKKSLKGVLHHKLPAELVARGALGQAD